MLGDDDEYSYFCLQDQVQHSSKVLGLDNYCNSTYISINNRPIHTYMYHAQPACRKKSIIKYKCWDQWYVCTHAHIHYKNVTLEWL